jgi:hypothetical protein
MHKLGYTDYIEHSSLHDRYAWYNNIPRDSRSIGSCRKFVEFLSVGFRLSDPMGSLYLSTRILLDFIGFRQNPDRNLITGLLPLVFHNDCALIARSSFFPWKYFIPLNQYKRNHVPRSKNPTTNPIGSLV